MFYSLINRKRDIWYQSKDCTVLELIKYIEAKNKLRDAQIDAIKTYLFLKIACKNKPLWELFYEGYFNVLDVSELEIKQQTKAYLEEYPCALSLYQYATATNEKGEQVSAKLEKEIKDNFDKIDYKKVFQDIFYNIEYTDYLFSLPMGAGKTFLMACIIYLDLYFAQNEPKNKSFAHNFMIFAPSGLKSSVVPSLKTIQKFDPSWVIPEPSASKIKKLIKFEVLDQSKTDNKSNKIKNPNVQKIAIHQPLDDLLGLVAITNAEKVILDRTEKINEAQLKLLSEVEQAKYKASNELRDLIGKIPNLSILIDEVHHATNEENKLRGVVTSWAKNDTLNMVIGFSGTPYLEKAEKVTITESLKTENKEISNIVNYYPLINGINNFLKKPTVKISSSTNRLEIVENGVREFLNEYKDTKYTDGTLAKLGIYCGTIETLEEIIFPKVCEIVNEYKMNPEEVILKFHKGNKEYSVSQDAQLEFDTLDTAISKKRIVLLVQIGKEGWDCKSLTGVILSQEGDCPTNMVLQTSCRCLRQVERDASETALIYLNEANAEKLNMQLKKQHHIDIKEFQVGKSSDKVSINRYSRMGKLKLPPVEFYQLAISYSTFVEKEPNIIEGIKNSTVGQEQIEIIKVQDFITGKILDRDLTKKEYGQDVANFDIWLYRISKGGFGSVSIEKLKEYEAELISVFNEITYEKNGVTCFSSKYKTIAIEENIRKSFFAKRSFKTNEETIKDTASLLVVEKLTSPIETTRPQDFIPQTKEEVDKIIKEDDGEAGLTEELKQAIEALKKSGKESIAKQLEEDAKPNEHKDRTYHYIPYKTDSAFEQLFLNEILTIKSFKENNLEVYYNGDKELTDFKIKTYKGAKNNWKYIGMYTPDFLILKRENGELKRVMIVETKGEGFAKNFVDKKEFMTNEFVIKNNEKFGYNRFDYLYLQDDLDEKERINQAHKKIKEFFEEKK